jgi:hypothetical protein
LDRRGFLMLRQWVYDAQLTKEIHEPPQRGELATPDRLRSCRTLEETPYMFVSHVSGSNRLAPLPRSTGNLPH